MHSTVLLQDALFGIIQPSLRTYRSPGNSTHAFLWPLWFFFTVFSRYCAAFQSSHRRGCPRGGRIFCTIPDIRDFWRGHRSNRIWICIPKLWWIWRSLCSTGNVPRTQWLDRRRRQKAFCSRIEWTDTQVVRPTLRNKCTFHLPFYKGKSRENTKVDKGLLCVLELPCCCRESARLAWGDTE